MIVRHAPADSCVVAGGLVDILHAGVVVTIRHDRSREFGALANRKGRPRRKNSTTGNVA
jgi:hypothetical protein